MPPKRGTPTMGRRPSSSCSGAVLAYLLGHLFTGSVPTASGLLVLWLAAGLGVVGFLDDFIKIKKQRSLGLRPCPSSSPGLRRNLLRGAGTEVSRPELLR
ncbi:hypothetical protein HX613_06810 [Brevibacterium sp. UCMA 11754]|nr:hypothetical protein [Brevibacterium sp. UCMA 11754]